jgi:hypothetical protein
MSASGHWHYVILFAPALPHALRRFSIRANYFSEDLE